MKINLMPESLIPAIAIAECKCCFVAINTADHFCQSCGFPLQGSEEEQSRFFTQRNYQQMQMHELNKKMESARNALYVLAAIFMLSGLFLFFVNRTEDSASGILITNTIVAVIFLLLGYWSAKKPLASIVSGMVLFVLVQLITIFDDPLSIFKGIILKIVIISYLIKGLMSALEAEKIQKQYNI